MVKPKVIKSHYIAVRFPLSQFFMEKYASQIHLINDDHGRAKYGNAAYFIPISIYEKIREENLEYFEE